jgi:hypothetical protein
MKWKVTKEVNISEFGTDVVLAELFNRIGDHIHDPEPRHDPILENMPEERLETLLTAIRKVLP